MAEIGDLKLTVLFLQHTMSCVANMPQHKEWLFHVKQFAAWELYDLLSQSAVKKNLAGQHRRPAL